MNMYVTDRSPIKCAQALDDFLLVESLKYITSTLCSACSSLGMWNAAMHPPIRTAAPITRWACESKNNFRWAYHYAKACADEYKYRFNLEHPEAKFIQTCWRAFNDYPHRPFKTEMTPFINLTPIASDKPTDECYRELLCERLWHQASNWTKRGRPDFYYPKKQLAV